MGGCNCPRGEWSLRSIYARSLGTTASDLREDYRRVTRRARGVMERLFYGKESETPRA